MIPLSERFNPENEDTRLSMATPIEEADRLAALHNINSDGLAGALELGGRPVPMQSLFFVPVCGILTAPEGGLWIVPYFPC